jgi:hypothetical protein
MGRAGGRSRTCYFPSDMLPMLSLKESSSWITASSAGNRPRPACYKTLAVKFEPARDATRLHTG